ncbi:MAG: S9 family peptidase, partial [Gemmatimonadaceae bacterium]|nr:S9 family peptidase [Gemmatimonadaceae bacterium]
MTLALLAAAVLPLSASAQGQTYPNTRKVDQVDVYFGEKVADPYRWLEEENAAETAKWVDEQNKVTFAYLEKIPYRGAVKARLGQLFNYARYGAPSRKGDYYTFSKNTGLQNQSVLYIQKGLDGEAEVLLDPNKFSTEGTTQLAGFSRSKNGRYAAYGMSSGGSDWREFRVMEIQSRKQLTDVIKWAKVTGISWAGNGFYYSRYDKPDSTNNLTSVNEGHKVYYHRVGTSQDQDELVYENKANPQRFHNVSTSEDERFAFLNISDRGKGKKGNAVFFRDLKKGDKTWTPIVAEVGDYLYYPIDNVG